MDDKIKLEFDRPSQKRVKYPVHKVMPQAEDHFAKSKYIPKFKTPEEFANRKIKMLRDDFRINISEAEEKYIRSLKTEVEINSAFKRILNKYWN